MEPVATPSPLLVLTMGLLRGDDGAWSQFHRDYGPRIFRQLLAATRGDHDLAREALQQAYLRIARYARPCAIEGMFIAWLRTVARTALSDCRRRRQTFWQMLQRRRDDPTATESASEDEERLQAALDYALLQLDPADRELLEAKYFSGLAVAEIAARMALSPKAVESRLTRARAELRRHLLSLLSPHE